MDFIIVRAKVRRLEEDEVGDTEKEAAAREKVYVWGRRSIKLYDIETFWSQSVNRCVIVLSDGEMILIAEKHADLNARVEEALKERRKDKKEEIEEEEGEDEFEDTFEDDEDDDDEDADPEGDVEK